MSPHSRIRSQLQPCVRRSAHRGFTLIELMVVVGIVLLLSVMTATAINLTMSGDKVRAAGRQVQSYLSGARDRAIYANLPRGVRFQLDNGNPTNSSEAGSRTVTSMVFIAPTPDWTQGTFEMEYDISGRVTIIRGLDGFAGAGGSLAVNAVPTQWYSLYGQNILRNNARILIPNDNTGTWYTVTTDSLIPGSPYYNAQNPALHLTTPYIGQPTVPSTVGIGVAAFPPGTGPVTYRLQLAPSVLPNQEPVLLPKGTVIDLDRCNKVPFLSPPNTQAALSSATSTLPQAWINNNIAFSTSLPFIYTNQMDVMFSPRGTVIGTAASRGLIHFYIAEQKDADQGTTGTPWKASAENSPGDKVIVSLFARTGAVSVHAPDTQDTTTIGGYTVYDYFRYAETGQVTAK